MNNVQKGYLVLNGLGIVFLSIGYLHGYKKDAFLVVLTVFLFFICILLYGILKKK